MKLNQGILSHIEELRQASAELPVPQRDTVRALANRIYTLYYADYAATVPTELHELIPFRIRECVEALDTPYFENTMELLGVLCPYGLALWPLRNLRAMRDNGCELSDAAVARCAELMGFDAWQLQPPPREAPSLTRDEEFAEAVMRG